MTIRELVQELEVLKEEVAKTSVLLLPDEQKKEAEKLEKQMQKQGFWDDQQKAQKVSQRHAHILQELQLWEDLAHDVDSTLAMAAESEKQEDDVLLKDITAQTKKIRKTFEKMAVSVLLSEEHDDKNAVLSIHAGAGGTEAQDWAEMIKRMLLRFIEKRGWKADILDEQAGSEAGIKSCVIEVSGTQAYGYLKSEHGVHRLVRISPFDAEKMRHTSFAMVEVLPELDDEVEIEMDAKDLRVDTFHAGGKGGQNVNKVETAIRITHLPTNTVVTCQNQRSQGQNKETAMRILKSRLAQLEHQKKLEEKEELRGKAEKVEWGSQIRSYVLHPYQMVKDHRSNVETQDTEDVLDGDLDAFVEGYLRWKIRH